ncbi:MAG: hypothetical protein ABIO02_03310, partial [Patescibacteria group bacterium]
MKYKKPEKLENPTKQVKINLSQELYEHIREKASIIGVSVPQFIKFAVLKEAQIQGITGFSNDLAYLKKRADDA